MLMLEETQEKFGYSAESLSSGSHKKVIVKCDYCGDICEKGYREYNKGRNIIEKDSCKKCRYKKRADMSMKQHGVSNSAQRPEVRKKISENCEGFDEKRLKTIRERYGTSNVMHNEDIKQKHKDSIVEKYGVDNISQVPEFRDKARKTNLEKYGNEEFLASEEGKKKKLEGMREKYGVDNAFQSEEVKEKIKRTNVEKYGVEYPTQSEEIMDKIEKTNLDRYGVKNPLQNETIKKRIKETNIEKFGTEFPTQNQDVKDKTVATNLDRYGVEYPTQNTDIYAKIIKTKIDNGTISVVDGKSMIEWSDELDKPYSTFIAQIEKYGFDKAIQIKPKDKNGSSLEQVIQIWLDSENINYISQFRVDNRIADFYLPDHNIIIEADGLYWHSELFLDNNYHMKKHQLYTDYGYRPLFFRSDEIEEKFNIVESILRNALHMNSNRIFARKCEIGSMIPKDSTKFFNENHLMGGGRGDTFTLMYEDEIVSAMRVVRLHNNHYEVSRSCNKLNTSVVGGFSKLLTRFIKTRICDSVTTFIDLRYGRGNYLRKFGFVQQDTHMSFRWTNGNDTFHRMKFPGNSGYGSGLVKIWDCGQAKYVFNRN